MSNRKRALFYCVLLGSFFYPVKPVSSFSSFLMPPASDGILAIVSTNRSISMFCGFSARLFTVQLERRRG